MIGESGMRRDIGEMRLAPNLKQLDSPPGFYTILYCTIVCYNIV